MRDERRVRHARPSGEDVVGLRRRRGLPERFAGGIGADPAVPVTSAPLAELDAVQHPVAGEPVIAGRVRMEDRVRTVAHQEAVELRRERSGDLERRVVALVAHRGEVLGQVRVDDCSLHGAPQSDGAPQSARSTTTGAWSDGC